MTEMITELTPEQESLIPVYREKWKAIALSTEPIDRQKAAEAVKAAYRAMRFVEQEPDIVFFDSPFAALKEIGRRLGIKLNDEIESYQHIWQSEQALDLNDKLNDEEMEDSELGIKLREQILDIEFELNSEDSPLWRELYIKLEIELEKQLKSLHIQLHKYFWWELFDNAMQPPIWACKFSLYDFCISVLNGIPSSEDNYCNHLCQEEQSLWESYKLMLEHCGWILPFEKICFICDRPIKLSLDNENRPHAKGETAISWSDGYGWYSYHGVELPEKYGKLHPHEWRSQWLLEEKNPYLCQVLIQGIGYERICRELQITSFEEISAIIPEIQAESL